MYRFVVFSITQDFKKKHRKGWGGKFRERKTGIKKCTQFQTYNRELL